MYSMFKHTEFFQKLQHGMKNPSIIENCTSSVVCEGAVFNSLIIRKYYEYAFYA